MHRFLILVLFTLAGVPAAQARPVSYPGGWTAITENNQEENSLLAHYTLTPKLALGYRMAYDRDSQDVFHGLQMNNLLKRWNNPDSQANIYLRSAIGLGQDEANIEGFTGLQADWENRRIMVMYENMAMISPNDRRNEFHQQAGFGIAPYVAEFGSLHTWAMLHLIHAPEDDENIQVAPMLRLFKGTALIEGGYNLTKQTPVLNATIRF